MNGLMNWIIHDIQFMSPYGSFDPIKFRNIMGNTQLSGLAQNNESLMALKSKLEVNADFISKSVHDLATKEYSRRMWFNDKPFNSEEEVREWFTDNADEITN